MRPAHANPAAHLAMRTEPDPFGGCWLWAGPTNVYGYGNFPWGPHKTRGAHRVAYEVHHGPIPSGLMVLHSCDVRACVNPAHLRVGTHEENMADMVARGRAHTVRGFGRFHPPGARKGARVSRRCDICAAPYEAMAGELRRGGGRFCGRSCGAVGANRKRWGKIKAKAEGRS